MDSSNASKITPRFQISPPLGTQRPRAGRGARQDARWSTTRELLGARITKGPRRPAARRMASAFSHDLDTPGDMIISSPDRVPNSVSDEEENWTEEVESRKFVSGKTTGAGACGNDEIKRTLVAIQNDIRRLRRGLCVSLIGAMILEAMEDKNSPIIRQAIEDEMIRQAIEDKTGTMIRRVIENKVGELDRSATRKFLTTTFYGELPSPVDCVKQALQENLGITDARSRVARSQSNTPAF